MERRLPLAVSLVLVGVVLTLSLLAYRTLRTELLTAADEHSAQVGDHLAQLLTQSAVRTRDRADSLAALPPVRAAARGDARARDEAVALMGDFVSRQGSVIGIGITTGGPEWRLWADGPAADSVVPEVLELRHPRRPETPAIGPIRAHGGPGLFYDVSSPLPDPEGQEAWLVIRYRIAAGEQARTLANLVGRDAIFLVGSSGSRVDWTDLQNSVPEPEPRGNGSFRWNGGEYRGTVLELAEAPWRVWTGVPRDRVLAPARAFAGDVALLGLLALLFGALVAGLLGRQAARPIARLTRAADGISRGVHGERVPESGPDEVVRLATAFNLMVERVEAATINLEDQVETRTRQLSGALEELKAAQEKLLRRERLAFLGQLAGGVGHELRNPLGVMTNAVYYLEAVTPDAPPRVREYHDILRAQLQLADKIVTDLLDFARSPTPRQEPLALDGLVEEQLRRLKDAAFAEVVRDFPPQLPWAVADRTQIGQVVFNLLTNASQAMEGMPGRLTIRAFAENGEVALAISDSGPGIPEDDRERVFEPLYTTRARGIGLGLSVSRSLVEVNRGRLDVMPAPGAGATFVIRLPAVESSGLPAAESSDLPAGDASELSVADVRPLPVAEAP